MNSGKNPMPSEWSATTRKSSGRESLAGWPLEAMISSPLRETVRVLRAEPATERAGIHRERRVQVRVAEERARGKVAAGVWRIRRLRGKGLLGRSLIECSTSVMGCSAANAGRAKPAIHDIKMIRIVCFISLFSFRPRLMSLSDARCRRLRP